MAPVKKSILAGQCLFQEGDDSTSFFLIQSGILSVRIKKNQGYIELAKLSQNEVIGELSFFDRLPRSASAVAEVDTEVLEISFESFDKIWASIPDYMKTILKSVANRLRKADALIHQLQNEKK